MVPLSNDLERRQTKVPVTPGFRREFWSVAHEPQHHAIASPDSVERHVRRPVSREEFQRIGDQEQKIDEILATLTRL